MDMSRIGDHHRISESLTPKGDSGAPLETIGGGKKAGEVARELGITTGFSLVKASVDRSKFSYEGIPGGFSRGQVKNLIKNIQTGSLKENLALMSFDKLDEAIQKSNLSDVEKGKLESMLELGKGIVNGMKIANASPEDLQILLGSMGEHYMNESLLETIGEARSPGEVAQIIDKNRESLSGKQLEDVENLYTFYVGFSEALAISEKPSRDIENGLSLEAEGIFQD